MVELTIEITNNCIEGCDFCSSNAIPDGLHLQFDKIKAFLSSYPNIDRINISGGEPLSHPDFYKILRHCEGITENVWVYTNAIKHLAYNSHVLKELDVKANVCLVPGKDVYIPKGKFSVAVLKFIPQGRGVGIESVKITTSGNFNGVQCDSCEQPVLLSNGIVVNSPCKKECEKTQ